MKITRTRIIKRKNSSSLLLGAVLGATLALSAPAQETKSAAPKEASPAGGVLRAIKVVATVEGLDLPTRSVTLKGPMGNFVTVRAASLDNLKKLRLGETIVVTYTEALAISLQKTQPGTRKE